MSKPVPGQFCWNELSVTDPAKARTFYEGLFGWSAQEQKMGPDFTYTLFTNGDDQVGGLMAAQPGQPPAWTSYVMVDDVDASCEKAAGLGGEVLQSPTDIPNIGRFALIKDPTDAVIAVWENKR